MTNDDGVAGIGLHVLATVLASRYEVFVVAPDRERSGVAHGFTLLNPLRCDPVPDAFGGELVREVYACSGTPVDCVKMGLLALWPAMKFDLVVSGINRGANLAVDTLYSGTVAGAMEALVMGYPAISISLVSRGRLEAHRTHFETAANVCLDIIRTYEERLSECRDFLLNVNVPGVPAEELRGIRHTVIGHCRYSDRYHQHKDPMGRPYYWLEGDLIIEDEREDADIVAVRDNFVSVTPLTHDLTSRHGVESLATWGPVEPSRPVAAKARTAATRAPARRRAAAGRKPPARRRAGRSKVFLR